MLTQAYTRSAVLTLFALTCFAAAGDTNDASNPPTIRSTVSEVRVSFFATDQNNRPLATLTSSDFAIVDNQRVVRNFRSFTHADETALDVVALVDMSASVAPRLRVALSAVLQLVAQEQSIADDNISVLFFGGEAGEKVGVASGGLRPAVLCSSGCRASDSMSKLLAVKSGSATPLFDALIYAADFMGQHRGAGDRGKVRPVLILFSDGYDTISLHSASDALQAVLEEGTPIYSVDMGKPENRSSNQTSGSNFLRRVSEATGGRYFSSSAVALRKEGAAVVLNAVLEDLRASYVVTYDLPSYEAGFHSLRLLPTHNLNLTFHSRNGYDYEPGVR